jgi:hypothetical protein
MHTIKRESAIQIIVLGVNIDSLSSHQVKSGNTRYEVPKPINLTAQTDSPRAEYVILVPKYAQRVAGIDRHRAI